MAIEKRNKMSNLKIDQEEFNRKAQHILDTVVRPQVERYEKAKAEQKNKMTAVEQLVSNIRALAYDKRHHLGMGDIRITQGLLDELEEQAKEIEKKIIAQAFEDGDYNYFYSTKTDKEFDNGLEYYNEKFKSE